MAKWLKLILGGVLVLIGTGAAIAVSSQMEGGFLTVLSKPEELKSWAPVGGAFLAALGVFSAVSGMLSSPATKDDVVKVGDGIEDKIVSAGEETKGHIDDVITEDGAETRFDIENLRTELKAAGVLTAAKERGLNDAQIEGILQNFGHDELPSEHWENALLASAVRLQELEDRLKSQSNDEPEITVLLAAAAEAIDAGDFDKADEHLAEAEKRDIEAGERRILRAAENRAKRGELARDTGRASRAADHYAEAARLAKPHDGDEWAKYKFEEGNTAYERGQYESNPALLLRAVTAYRHALKVYTQDDMPLQWATTQNNLGAALRTLGESEEGRQRLDDAVTAHRHAIKVYTQDDMPLDWAMTQNNLGAALQTLGEREEGTQRLDDAGHRLSPCYKSLHTG